MSMQQRDGGMISQGIGRENIQTIEPIALSQMSIGEPIKLSTTLFVFLHPIIYFFHKLVGAVNALGREKYGSQIRIGESHHF